MMMMMEDEGHSQMGGVGGSAIKVQYLADPDPENPYVFGPPGSGSVRCTDPDQNFFSIHKNVGSG